MVVEYSRKKFQKNLKTAIMGHRWRFLLFIPFSQWGLILLGLVVLTIGVVVVWRKKYLAAHA